MCVGVNGCGKKKDSSATSTDAPAPQPAASAEPAPPDAAPPPPPPGAAAPAPAEVAAPAAATPQPEQKSNYEESLKGLQKFKKWTLLIADGGESGKAQVRREYDKLPPNEQQAFQNYCRSCAIKFP